MKLSKEPYKGTRDFYPEDTALRGYVFGVWREVAESFGYEPYDASLLEETELYRSKSSQEIVSEQTYSFEDRGGREVTIRPEMTPSVARMVARKRKELAFPLRWYSMPNLFRYERPQRGRLREHWQLNVDYFGEMNNNTEAEVIALADSIMKRFGANESMYVIRLNSRSLMKVLFDDLFQLDADSARTLSRLIDAKAKMDEAKFAAGLQDVLGENAPKLVQLLEADSLEAVRTELAGVPAAQESIDELAATMNLLELQGIRNLQFDLGLMRGFDYYTGIVFEIFDTSPENNRSLFGGGRYDDLVGIFDVDPVPGMGFGMGDVTIHDFLETHNLLPEPTSVTDLMICVLGEDTAEYANALATQLRSEGLRVAIDFTGRKVQKQMKTAEKKQIPWLICVGENEKDSGKLELKNLATRETQKLLAEDVTKTIQAQKDEAR